MGSKFTADYFGNDPRCVFFFLCCASMNWASLSWLKGQLRRQDMTSADETWNILTLKSRDPLPSTKTRTAYGIHDLVWRELQSRESIPRQDEHTASVPNDVLDENWRKVASAVFASTSKTYYAARYILCVGIVHKGKSSFGKTAVQ